MKRRCLLLITAIAVLVLVGVGVLALALRPHQPSTAITRENAAKIQHGMTVAEVEALLGGPARDDTTGPLEIDISYTSTHGACQRDWRSDEVVIAVCFDADGRVIDSCNDPVQPLPRQQDSVFDVLRRWLSL
jgi:outer membrane protein assembly factor BamE (lipoprotein component of BamABCDE complex)